MMYIKEPLLLIGKCSLYGISGFHILLSVVRRHITVKNVSNTSLNEAFLSFLNYKRDDCFECPVYKPLRSVVVSESLVYKHLCSVV